MVILSQVVIKMKTKMKMMNIQRPWVGVGGILPIMESLCTTCISLSSCLLTHGDDDDNGGGEDDDDDDDGDDCDDCDDNDGEKMSAPKLCWDVCCVVENSLGID